MVITGGSEGMGKAVACQLAAKGANVVLVARTVKKLQDALDDVKVNRYVCMHYARRCLPSLGVGCESEQAKVPLYQCRSYERRAMRADH